MPLPGTRADVLQVMHTGAASHAIAQLDQALSFGNYRSSTRCDGRSFLLRNALNNVTVDHVSGPNGTGNGNLTAVADDWLAWTAPDGTQGEAVEITNGQQRLLEASGVGGAGKYVLVSRTSTDRMVGSCTVEILDALNNVVGMSNADLLTSVKYRAIGFYNASSSAEIRNLVVTADNDTHLQIFTTALQPTQPSGNTYAPVNESTAPGGVWTPDDVATISVIRPGEWAPLWLIRDNWASVPQPYVLHDLTWTYDVIG